LAKTYTVGQAAGLLGQPYWRIHHAYRAGKVPEPARFNNARQLNDEDLRRLAEHFGVPMPAEEVGERRAAKESGVR
jgi:cytochrome c553